MDKDASWCVGKPRPWLDCVRCGPPNGHSGQCSAQQAPPVSVFDVSAAVCLLKVQDVIHLYPMWSAALQGNVERFAVDAAAADGVEQDVPVCRTNAVVESHFKSVKHGRLDGRLRVRPRAFVSAELKYVLGKLNERKLPHMKVQRGKKDTASTEEQWRRRKRPARYADAAAASYLLKKIRRRATPAATVKQDAPSAAAHIADTAQKMDTTVQDVTSAANAPPVQMKELDSDAIMKAMEDMHAAYTNIDGLQHTGLGQCVVGHSVPRFRAVVRPFVQVLNIGDHWVTVTNQFTPRPNTVYCYDSLHGTNIASSTVMQLTSLLRRQTEQDVITVLFRSCAKQYRWSRLCGYFALAAAYAVCSGTDPTGRDYDPQTMVDVIDRNVRTGRVDQVPPAHQGPAVNLATQVVDKQHCICHQPSATCSKPVTMIECSHCGNWFHVDCVSTTDRQRRRDSAVWTGPCCGQALTMAPPPVIVIDAATSQPSTTPTTAAAAEPRTYAFIFSDR